MDRISTATKAVDLFGVGKHGFKDGNLGSGIAPTDLNAAWFNQTQEELLAIIEAAGLAPAAGTLNQVLLALRSAGVFATPTTGDRSTKAATTQMFANEFASSLAGSGYQKLPSGVIVQWGSGSIASGGSASLTFPLTFPTACWALGVSENSAVAWSATNFTLYGHSGKSASGATVKSVSWNGSGYAAANGNYDFIAIGK